MSFGMTDTNVRHQISDIRHQMARCRGRAGHRPNRLHLPDSSHQPRLRSRVGFRLVEAGLRLIADGPQAHG